MKGHGLTRAAAGRTSVSAGRGLGLKIPFLFLPAATEPLKRLHLRGDNGCDSCQLSSQSCCHCAECVTALQDAPKGWRRTDRPRFTAAETGGPRGWTDPPRVTPAGPGRGPLDPPLAPQHRPGELRARGSSYSCRPGQPRTASPRVPGGPGPRTWRMRDAGGEGRGPTSGELLFGQRL